MLSKEQIRGIQDIKTEKVPCPEWEDDPKKKADAFLWVRGLAGIERDAFEQSLVEAKKKGAKVNLANMRTKLVQRSVVTSEAVDSDLYFSEADIDWLCQKNAATLDRLYGVAARLSGISEQDMEELEKNCESIPAEDSANA